jgi:aerobic-type carbon monoxide dehydrogenase small subunit (CoxS/CutS family)
MKSTFQLTVNGHARTVTTDPERPLLDVLREDLDLTGTKYACGEGRCGACTVLVDGRSVRACVTDVRRVDKRSIVTIEGLATEESLHPIQEAFVEAGALQCGYCTSGMILQTLALLERKSDPSDREILAALNANICRCNGYPKVLDAVRRAAEMMRAQP